MENLFWTIIGLILGILSQVLIKGTIWEMSFIQNWRRRREQKQINKILEQNRMGLTLGSLRIERVMAQKFSHPLTSNDIECFFDPEQRELPPDLQELEFTYLPQIYHQLISQGRTIDENDLYGLKSIRIERPQEHGQRRNKPEFTFEPTNFKHYIMLNESLDKPLLPEINSENVTIRERYNLDLPIFHWSDLKEIPVYQWFATCTGVIAKNNQLVIAVRSEMQAIINTTGGSSWHRASLSCAEGMVRDIDSVTPPPVENPSPFETAFRSLEDELGLHRGEHFKESEVKLIGLGYDKKRCQPIGIFNLELKDLGFIDVYKCWEFAKDRHENKTLMPIAVEPRSMADLLLGRHTFDKKPIRLFSNHQQIGALLIAIHRLGLDSIEDALTI